VWDTNHNIFLPPPFTITLHPDPPIPYDKIPLWHFPNLLETDNDYLATLPLPEKSAPSLFDEIEAIFFCFKLPQSLKLRQESEVVYVFLATFE
jgi:hypothetical protein